MLLTKLRHASIPLSVRSTRPGSNRNRPTVRTPRVCHRTTGTSQRWPSSASLARLQPRVVTKVQYHQYIVVSTSLQVDLGSRVKEGDALLVLDSPKLAKEKTRYVEASGQWRSCQCLIASTLSIDRSKPLTPEFLEAQELVAGLASEKFQFELAFSNYGLYQDDDIANVPKRTTPRKGQDDLASE